MKVRYLYESGESEGQQYGGKRRRSSTDSIWSIDVYKIEDRYIKEHQPTLYYLYGGLSILLLSKSFHPLRIPSLVDVFLHNFFT